MNHTTRIALLSLACAISHPIVGHAAEFAAIQSEKNALVFTFRQMNVAMEGRFKKFIVKMNFDPDKVADAKVSIEVDLASIDTGFSEGNEEVAGKQWFSTKSFPVARFASSNIVPVGNNRYDVTGQLSIKGRTQVITVPTTVTTNGDQASFDGSVVINRADFSIGEGPWSDFKVVANEVRIAFHILAASGK